MNLLVISIVSAPLVFLADVPFLLADIGLSAQNVCLSFLPPSSYHEIYSGLVCGKALQSKTSLVRLLETSQLIHLIVVSGSHLVLLHAACQFLSKKILRRELPYRLSVIALLFYTVITGFQPPCARAFFFFTARHSHTYRNHAFLCSILFTLLFIPSWIFSASFQLSVMASLFLLLTPHLSNSASQPAMRSQILLTVGLAPLLGFISLMGLLLNLIIAPILSLFLFPLALLGILFHPVASVFDVSLVALEALLQRLPLDGAQIAFPNWSFFVIYLALIFSFFHVFNARRKQEQIWHSPSSS